MSAALARRDDGCASDLLMDRWLLGELPGSDEARRLELHVKECSACQARLLALRSLYSNRPAPRPPRPPEAPRLLSAPPSSPGQSGVVQVVILRDGLLVGTEVFTPGRYAIGSASNSALKLEDLEGDHARFHLRGDRIAIEATAGELFVNGYRVTCCELRPIDEVAIGPYVLRARVLDPAVHPERSEAESKGQGEDRSAEAASRKPNVVPLLRALSKRTSAMNALQLELHWGDARQLVSVFTKPPSPHELAPFGAVTFTQTTGGFELELRTGETLKVPTGTPARASSGPLTLVATVVLREAPLPRRSVRDWPWLFIALAATLLSGLIAFSAFAPVPDEEPFETKPLPAISTHFAPKPKPVVKPDTVHLSKTPPKHSAPRAEAPRHPPPHFQGLPPLNIHNIVHELASIGANATKAPRHTAGVGVLPGIGMGHPAPGLPGFDRGAITIGGGGLRNAGGMVTDGIGHGPVRGVAHPTRSAVTASSPGYDRDAVAKVIAAHLAEISRCYENAMMTAGAFSGKMTVEWAISTSGTVAGSSVKDTDITNAKFGSCVLTALNGWRFPPAKARVVVSYPFHVSAVGY